MASVWRGRLVEGEGSRPLQLSGDIRFGVVTAWPDEDWHSQRLIGAIGRRGAVCAIDPAALEAWIGPDGLSVWAGDEDVGALSAVVLARGLGRAGDGDVQFELYRALEEAGVFVTNRIDALLAAQDKLRTSWLLRRAEIATPTAAVAQTPASALAALEAMGEAVVKPIEGSLGDGVQRVRPDAAGRREVAQRVERDGAAYLQAFVPNPGRDARLFVVGGRVEGAIERVAPSGEWIANVARGATALPLRVSAALEALAVAAAQAVGLDWAGVDVVVGAGGPTVIEVNGTPSWAAVHEVTGRDMAEPIAEHVLARALRRAGKGRSVSKDVRARPHG
jgi:tetrahydromethanopterin:alpha-L-glutamate ligase